MPVVLDTDHVTILHRQIQPAYDRLSARLERIAPDDLSTTIVTFQEQTQGWLAYINRARTPEQIVHAYAELETMQRSFCKMNILSFTEESQHQFAALRKQRVRIPTMDLRIASIALATESTLLSRTLGHFRNVPALVVEDWTR